MSMPGACGTQKTVVSYRGLLGTKPWVLCMSSRCSLTAEPQLQPQWSWDSSFFTYGVVPSAVCGTVQGSLLALGCDFAISKNFVSSPKFNELHFQLGHLPQGILCTISSLTLNVHSVCTSSARCLIETWAVEHRALQTFLARSILLHAKCSLNSNNNIQGWRSDLAIESTCCSCRRPWFNSQHLRCGSQPFVTSF